MNTSSHAVSTTNGSRSRALLIRIASSITSKPLFNVDDFFIHLDEPTRQYSVGEAVKGSVRLLVQKPARITHITLSLHGFVKVYKNPTVPGDGVPSEVKTPSPGRSRTGAQYHGNGLVSFFEDEMVVCGDGRLNPGQYSFAFESQFPCSRLPSSLDFERGTISYVLVATLTRPTTIAPTLSCERKLTFIESIDIAFQNVPKPRVITLTPLTKRPRPKRPVRGVTEGHEVTTNSVVTSRRTSDSSSDANVSIDETPASPASEASIASGPSSSLSFQVAQTSRPVGPGESGITGLKIGNNVITASIELLQGGFLAGDLVPVRISIRHIRPVKSMHGVILTLYRKARIDPHPIFPAGSSFIARKSRQDDVIPRSRTGLGGLSLAASSSHLFRMDLAQAFAPLIVNPLTLEAEVKTAVRVPEDVFPTISGIPGDVINFTYHVEVVMDLTGKLANQDRLFPRMKMTSQSPDFSFGSKPSFAGYGAQYSLETYHLMDTTEIRREKSITDCTFEVTIGSKDSSRINARRPQPGEENFRRSTTETGEDVAENEDASSAPADASHGSGLAGSPPLTQPPPHHPPLILPPDIEEPTDEKGRIRLAEQRLLPSAPPDDSSRLTSPQPRPSAPMLESLQMNTLHCDCMNTMLSHVNVLQHSSNSEENNDANGDSAPAYARNSAGETQGKRITSSAVDDPAQAPARMGEDKQELERRRLLALVSSPNDGGGGADEGQDADAFAAVLSHASAPNHGVPAPSAPVLDEEEDDERWQSASLEGTFGSAF